MEAGWAGGSGGGNVWAMPSVDVHENFLTRSQAVVGGGHPLCQPVHTISPS